MTTTIPDESDGQPIIPPESTEAAVRDANETLQGELEEMDNKNDGLQEKLDEQIAAVSDLLAVTKRLVKEHDEHRPRGGFGSCICWEPSGAVMVAIEDAIAKAETPQ